MLSYRRHSIPDAPAFAREFLLSNKWQVLHVLLAHGAVIWLAADEKWLPCGLFVLVALTNSWELIKRAAGLPPLRRKQPEEMTPREAFWLDPSAVFSRGPRQNPPRQHVKRS